MIGKFPLNPPPPHLPTSPLTHFPTSPLPHFPTSPSLLSHK
ncbi:hypothetical protein [Microcystis aeruginosa]|nr:hypothetical protein [Microcystis aeruginosa]